MTTPPPADPACIGLHDLFDSTNIEDHIAAATFCEHCPALTWCHTRTPNRDNGTPQHHQGTWAGRLYRNGYYIATWRTVPCPTCHATVDEPCTSRVGTTNSTPHAARRHALDQPEKGAA